MLRYRWYFIYPDMYSIGKQDYPLVSIPTSQKYYCFTRLAASGTIAIPYNYRANSGIGIHCYNIFCMLLLTV